VQGLALGLVELHEVYMGPPFKPVKVPLDSIPSLQSVDRTTQLGVIGKLAEGALNPDIHVADKDVEHCQSQYGPLSNKKYRERTEGGSSGLALHGIVWQCCLHTPVWRFCWGWPSETLCCDS